MGTDKLARLTSWHADWRGVKALVVGLEAAGFSAVDTLCELGSEVLTVANSADSQMQQLVAVVGAKFASGSGQELRQAASDFAPDIVIVADYDLYTAVFAGKNALLDADGVAAAVWSDTELAWRVRDKSGKSAQWLLVSGETGKQETANLTALMLLAAGFRAVPVSKRRVPVLDAVREPAEHDFYVVSVSAKDLAHTASVAPHSSALVNLGSAEGDAAGAADNAARDNFGQVYANTRLVCVYNRAEPATEEFLRAADVAEGCRAVSVGFDIPPLAGLGVVEDLVVDRGFHTERRNSALELGELRKIFAAGIRTPQQFLNFLTAAALARACGAEPKAVHAALARVREL